MGVDGIGSGGGRPIGGIAGEAGSVASVTAEPARELGSAQAAPRTEGSAALEQLARGEIDLNRYLDTRVAEAVKHLVGKLPEPQVDFVRSALREQLSSDPVLLELVRRTTGAVPPPPTE